MVIAIFIFPTKDMSPRMVNGFRYTIGNPRNNFGRFVTTSNMLRYRSSVVTNYTKSTRHMCAKLLGMRISLLRRIRSTRS
jgi:hypothetical protein